MEIQTVKKQIESHVVAIISLIIAIIALCYTAWREETTEINRIKRAAGFEVLKNLGELQVIVNNSFYQKEGPQSNPFLGWGNIAFIGDLAELLPKPIPETTAKLHQVWSENWQKISSDDDAATKVSEEIDVARNEVLAALRSLK